MVLSATILIFVKTLALIGLLLYVLFAAVMIRQEQLMENVLEDAFEPVLKVLTVAHFIAAIAVLVLAAVLL